MSRTFPVSRLRCRSIFDLGVGEDVAPEAGGLMRIIDFDHGELLHELVVDLQFVLLKLGDDLLTEVDRDQRD